VNTPKTVLVVASFALSTFISAFAAQPIDGRSASRWRAQPGWQPRPAAEFGVADKDGWLEFSVTGEGKMMTWTMRPSPGELEHEPRYLIFTYRASGLAEKDASYLFLVKDGSPNWRHYLDGADLIVDGREHVLVVDVLSYRPPEPINRFALRITGAGPERGRLMVKVRFSNDLPPGVEPRTAPPVEPAKMRIEFEDIPWQSSANWTPRPPERHEMHKTAGGVLFKMAGQNRSMRWSAVPPKGLDTGKMPYVSVRYRARGRFGPYGYAFYLGVVPPGKKERVSAYPMEPGDVEGDGVWHVFHKKLDEKGIGTSMAVGIDALSPEAEIEMDYIEFSSHPAKTPIEDVLAFEKRPGPWPAGKDGFHALPLPKDAAHPNHFMIPRMGIGSWFDTPHVTVAGIPFEVPTDPAGMLASGSVDEGELTVGLPPGTTEVLLLMAASFPRGEFFGANWRRPAPLPILSEPERMTIELVYPDGSSDRMLPVHVTKKAYGVGHDIAAYAVHPSKGRSPSKLILHDNMRNAGFGIVGLTANTGQPRVAEPEVQAIWYPPVKKPPMSDAVVSFRCDGGLTWDGIESAMLGRAVDLAGRPVFSLKLADKEVFSSDWKIESAEKDGKGLKAVATYSEGGVSLRAVFESKPAGRNGVMLSLDLRNAGKAPVTGTLFFPRVSGLKIGTVEDTWYFCARRGGVINRVPCYWRDEIGEAHPVQVDGFFNPRVGAGVCFMPRDLDGLFRWYRVAKDESGGGYSLEFLPQTVEPGGGWKSVPVLVAAVPGDWKDQLAAYVEWARTWYKPFVPRKQWFREVFAFGPGSPTSNMHEPLEERIDFVAKAEKIKQAIGACDYMHLFGWAKTEKYGHWGDYDHYDAVGGLERFVRQVRRCQEAGIPVGLYIDGYLVSTRSLKPTKEQREKWAIRKENGEMLYHKNYDAHSMCPYVGEWRDYLAAVYKRVAAEVKPSGMYLDELGKSMTHRTCYSKHHGHPSPAGMSPGERFLIKQIREIVPPGIATYCEYVPDDVTSQFIDGAFGHVSLYGHRQGYDEVAPHYVNLQRFAFPDFKTFELIYYVPQVNGNWFLLKYPFFNGDGYYLTTACLLSDEHARAFYRNVFRIQHAHSDAFTSSDVEPLVRTEVPNLFANRFSTARKTVWTLFNANYRTVRGRLLVVPHKGGAKYLDAWSDKPIRAVVKDGTAELWFEIGPRSVGCVVRE